MAAKIGEKKFGLNQDLGRLKMIRRIFGITS
jgi:hypothetical protein